MALPDYYDSTAATAATRVEKATAAALQQKVDELIDYSRDASLASRLTPEELARLAGGFGATDASVAAMFLRERARDDDDNANDPNNNTADGGGGGSSHHLRDVVNEGLTAAVRAGDYHTARQLLILYSLVATADADVLKRHHAEHCNNTRQHDDKEHRYSHRHNDEHKHEHPQSSASGNTGSNAAGGLHGNYDLEERAIRSLVTSAKHRQVATSSGVPPPPPPPPLDTDRLRSATNSDGLLAVLGAAQILRAMQDGTARRRTEEAILAVEEWVDYGENSMAFRISSWKEQRAAQGDLHIATEQDSKFMAFVSTKAVSNRRNFAGNLRRAVAATSFTDGRFLLEISDMVNKMSRPCLRLELLQYVLGLDNRYSIAHVARSVELAATCLGIRVVGNGGLGGSLSDDDDADGSSGDEATARRRSRSSLTTWLGFAT